LSLWQKRLGGENFVGGLGPFVGLGVFVLRAMKARMSVSDWWIEV
jgi:hypothetical protein